MTRLWTTTILTVMTITGLWTNDIQEIRGFVYKQTIGNAKISYDMVELIIKIDINTIKNEYEKLKTINEKLASICKSEVVINNFKSCNKIAELTKLKLVKLESGL